MVVSGHKSLASLAIYERVKSDEKMMMGMSLTYSLLNPEEVSRIKAAQILKERQENILELPQPMPAPAIMPGPMSSPQSVSVGKDAIQEAMAPSMSRGYDTSSPKPMQNAVVPYQAPTMSGASNDIDFLDLLCEMENDDENQALSIAAQQIEQQLCTTAGTTTTTSNTSLMQKKTPVTTFMGCTFGNIGTLNIHIHKN